MNNSTTWHFANILLNKQRALPEKFIEAMGMF